MEKKKENNQLTNMSEREINSLAAATARSGACMYLHGVQTDRETDRHSDNGQRVGRERERGGERERENLEDLG